MLGNRKAKIYQTVTKLQSDLNCGTSSFFWHRAAIHCTLFSL